LTLMTALNLAQPDITLLLDKKGVIKEITLSERIAEQGVDAWIGRAWETTVGDVGGSKVRSMIEQALTQGVSAFRQINQHFPSGAELPIEFTTVRLGGNAGICAIGKNLQTVAELQSRLVAAQQAIERDYWKLREVETRYRMLFDASAEAVVVVQVASLAIVEANPAASRALGVVPEDQAFLDLLGPGERTAVRAMFERVREQGRAPGVLVHLGDREEPWMLRASLMNANNRPAFLLQLAPVGRPQTAADPRQAIDLGALVDGLPDGFVVVDGDGVVLRANQAFLDLVQVVSRSQVIGERLGRWLSRPGADLNVLLANVRRHGFVRLFATRIHSELGSEAEVEISAGSRNEGEQRHYGLLIRDVGTRLPAPRQRAGQGARLGAATKPVGSAPLRDLVSETVTVIEQHYIETALDLTRGNRKAAAELLGLSRQGLYAKLARYGLDGSNLTDNEPV
jgi:transcriptional regulator PpsR